MTSLSFPELRAAMFEHYNAGQYAEALALVNRHAPHLPQYRSHTLIWQVCLQAVSGQAEAALRTLQEGLDQGLWYAPSALRGDSDLAGLQGHPEFERMVAHCTEHYEEASRRARPGLTVIEPEQAQPPYPLLIALHGRGSSMAEAAETWNTLADHGWLVALPQSSQLIGQEAYTWDDPRQAEAELAQHLEQLHREHTFDPQRVVLAGFSQGAGLAISLVIQGLIPAAGFIAVAPYLREVDALLEQPAEPPAHPPYGVIITGAYDPEQEMFEKIERLLQQRRLPYRRIDYEDLAHDYPPDFLALRQESLEIILKTRQA
ncbi:MAG: alpha/beta hydrolase [Chloroflexota bacterium]